MQIFVRLSLLLLGLVLSASSLRFLPTIPQCRPDRYLPQNEEVERSKRIPLTRLYAGGLESDDEDEVLELKMAMELYNDLRGPDVLLSVAAFKAWEDVADLIGKQTICLNHHVCRLMMHVKL
jgi:hypothetical protein